MDPFAGIIFIDRPDAATCQVCGAEHALRGGKLVRHHYASHWRVKSGPCPGSGALPLEVDTTVVTQRYEITAAEIAALQAELAQRDPHSNAPADVNRRWTLRRLYAYRDWLSAQLEYADAPVTLGGTLRYRALTGSIEQDVDGYFGRALDEDAGCMVRYRAGTLDRLVRAFRRAIDQYLIDTERGPLPQSYPISRNPAP